MLKSFGSPPDDNNGHLRNLLDQRNARVQIHDRLSAAGSDCSDTTSVYSHSYLSPRPSEFGESHNGHTYSSSVPRVGTERYDPDTSILDLTDDHRVSYASHQYENPITTSSEEATDESEIIARMSYLGPKMRVHSRAPWEEEALEEVDEENVPASHSSSRRHAAKNIVPSLSSPRPSIAGSGSRQSGDSSISTNRSFETINSQVSLSHTRGAFYTLAQEGTSSNSLGRRTPVKENFLNKFPVGRVRGESPNTTNAPNIPAIPSPMSSPANNHVLTSSGSTELSPIKTHSTNSASSSYDSIEVLSVRKAFAHPYANPDLVVSYPEGGPASPYTLSHITVTEPSVDSMAKYSQSKFTTSDPSADTAPPKVRTSPISTKSISSPVTVVSPQDLYGGGPERSLPGWTERPSTIPFTLISLEEARAKRMRTSTDTGAATLPSSDSGTPLPLPGNNTNYSASSSSSPLASFGSKVRGRSISAGPNSKNALHNMGRPKLENRGSEPILKEDFHPPPSGKTLRNKRSGFLKIFNRDRDLQNVPPVPSIPDGISHSQPSQPFASDSIPAPPLSQAKPFMSQDSSMLQADIPITSKGMKRSSPSLSIVTAQVSPTRSTIPSRSHAMLGLPSPGSQSAPANLPEFPVLRLRPVSKLFSASFGDLMPCETQVQGTFRSDSPPSSRSPLTTPLSPSRPFYNNSFVSDENHPAIIALQEQMLSSKTSWERHIWKLEGQVRDLKAELARLKDNDEYCDKCGRGETPPRTTTGIVNRPRAQTGTSARCVNLRS